MVKIHHVVRGQNVGPMPLPSGAKAGKHLPQEVGLADAPRPGDVKDLPARSFEDGPANLLQDVLPVHHLRGHPDPGIGESAPGFHLIPPWPWPCSSGKPASAGSGG